MSLIATRTQEMRLRNPQVDKNMSRLTEWGALDFFLSQTNAPDSMLTDETKRRAFSSMGTDIKIPVIDYDGTVTVANERTCVIADAENTSKLMAVVWKTYAFGFTMVPTMFNNNEIDYQKDFEKKMLKFSRKFLDKVDKDAIAALEAAKTQKFGNLLYYTQTANDVQVNYMQRNDILGDLHPMFRSMDYSGQLHIVGDTGVDAIVRKLEQHGIYNDVNKQLEYANKIFHFTNNMVLESENFAQFYAIESGNVGMLTRVDREALRRATSKAGHEWDVINFPFAGFQVGTHYYESVGDQSEIAGAATADMKCNIKEHYGFSVDIAFVVAYNSAPATVSNPIMKVEIKKDGSQFGGTPVYITNAEQIGSGSTVSEMSVNIAKIGGSPVAESALKVDLDKVKGAAVSSTGGVVDVKVNSQASNLNVEVKNADSAPVPTKAVGG